MNNGETKLGTLAWHNLRNFFHEETAEYKTTCMKHALNVTKCSNMDQLAIKLDQWIYAKEKIAKLDPAKALPEDYQFVIFKQLITKQLEDVIETNKTDYGTYQKALDYVQEQLRKHQEESTPQPMDIGNLDQQNGTDKQEQQQ